MFKPVKRPEKKVPDLSLDEELQNSAEDATLTLYFINMVCVRGYNLANRDLGFDKSDPYVAVHVGDLMHRTEQVENDLNPVWNQKMNFFVPSQPEKITFKVIDANSIARDEDIGVGTIEYSKILEIGDGLGGGTFDGEVELFYNEQPAGSVRAKIKVRVMKPIETEVKLSYTEKQLALKTEEQDGTEAALDESEKLREEAVSQLSEKEQEILKKAEELTETKDKMGSELSEKEKQLLSQAELIENKVKELEEANASVMEAEKKKEEAEKRLEEARKESLVASEALEKKQEELLQQLSAKDDEIATIGKDKGAEIDELKEKYASESVETEAKFFSSEQRCAILEKRCLELTEKTKDQDSEINKLKKILDAKDELLAQKKSFWCV